MTSAGRRSGGGACSVDGSAVEHLRQVERHISRGEELIALQRQIIARLQRIGQDVTQAQPLLDNPEVTQRLHLGTPDEVRRELQPPD
jgi:hypothetical protein